MPESISNSIGLGHCLHDGLVERIDSDLMSRSLSFIIDSPFHWSFHHLPDTTRFELRFEEVRSLVAFGFEAWPGGVEPSQNTPWEEAQLQRAANSAKGRMVSTSWSDFVAQVATDEEHIILTAELQPSMPNSILKFGINSYPSSDYRDIEISAERLRLFVGENELTLTEFIIFGDAYWNDRSQRNKTHV